MQSQNDNFRGPLLGLNSFPRLRVIPEFFRIRLAWFRCVLSLVIHLWRTSDVAAPSGFLKNAQDLVRVFSGVYVMVCFLLGNCGSLKEFCFTKDVDNFLIAHYHCQKRVKERKVNRNLCAPVKPRSKRDWQGHPTAIFGKISVRKTIWDLEFSEHLL